MKEARSERELLCDVRFDNGRRVPLFGRREFLFDLSGEDVALEEHPRSQQEDLDAMVITWKKMAVGLDLDRATKSCQVIQAVHTSTRHERIGHVHAQVLHVLQGLLNF